MQRETDKQVLEAIKKHNMIFISAQPDQVYFHWQVSLYLYQFAKHDTSWPHRQLGYNIYK